MGIGAKFVTKAQFEEWARNLERKLITIASRTGGGGGTAGGAMYFIQLSDCPSSYAGQAFKAVRVNADESGLAFGGEIRLDITESDVSSPPTGAELDALFPDADTGYMALIKDTSSGGSLWLVVYDGASWWVLEFGAAA